MQRRVFVVGQKPHRAQAGQIGPLEPGSGVPEVGDRDALGRGAVYHRGREKQAGKSKKAQLHDRATSIGVGARSYRRWRFNVKVPAPTLSGRLKQDRFGLNRSRSSSP
jgi:hypothetical protein